MNIKPIKNEKDYKKALKEIEMIFDAKPNTKEGDYLEILSILVNNYEENTFHIPQPDPIEAIKYFMNSRGLSRKDLEPCIGSRARVSEVLNKKRPLSINMVRKLHLKFNIPTDILIKQYKCKKAA